jgi:hypothetical protein
MPSRREQILAAVATTLAGTTGVSTRIYRSREEALQRNEAPAIIITPGPDTNQAERAQGASMCRLDQRLTIEITIYVRGAIPDQLADPIEVDLHKKLMAATDFNGLTSGRLLYLSRIPQMETGDLTVGWITTEYAAEYRCSRDDLSVA